MISDTHSCLKIGATKISYVLDKGYNTHAAFQNSDHQIFIRFHPGQDVWATIFACLHGVGPISKIDKGNRMGWTNKKRRSA